ncbi:hypothetical protein E3N88_38569 [Mikania micrantha]|uniref:Uncharacterized protein n=1 Tax=Mikania micrantha TaxID=192012 RepID=A0A5N6LWX0_9ASTR|nr:hypothetical protein E3N88_38569 [Mikania micrantha]
MKRKRKSSSLSTHYSEVNHRTPKVVLSYGPNIAETHVATEKRDVYLQQQQDGTIGFYAGSISGVSRTYTGVLTVIFKSPQVGFEPTPNRLTADRSTTELLRNNGRFHLKEFHSRSQPMTNMSSKLPSPIQVSLGCPRSWADNGLNKWTKVGFVTHGRFGNDRVRLRSAATDDDGLPRSRFVAVEKGSAG